MPLKYPHLLSPIRVGNIVLKNRLVSSNALPHFLQGPELYPAEPIINHMVGVAKNGAAIVTFADWTDMSQRSAISDDGQRFPMFDLDRDPSVENYICQLADQIHYYNSKISLALMPFEGPDPYYGVSDEPAVEGGVFVNLQGNRDGPRFGTPRPVDVNLAQIRRHGEAGHQMTKEMIADFIETYAQRAAKYHSLGFDMVTLHCAYRASMFAKFLSAKTNHRTDEYGGSIEKRARFLMELCARIKELCGKDFPIEVQITAEEEGGNTLEETCRLAKILEGYVDIFQFRAETGDLNHPTGFNSKDHVYLELEHCAAVKATGTKILCEPIGGFQDPDDMEEAIASGKADLIGGARLFICDFDYYDKIREGRTEDIVPCIRCNKCHVPGNGDKWLSYCSVNPRMGIDHRLEKLTRPVSRKRNVAVVGGGPAGMRAALFARERGYNVTLFEASGRLGGQLKLMDAPTFKWPLAKYRDWLIAQVNKNGVDVRMNTRATKDMLAAGGYDAVLLALGAEPNVPDIPGADKAYSIFTVFGSEAKMGKRCVVIGGSESGTEAALYLAENGHDVTILTRGTTLAPLATPIHYREMMEEYYIKMESIRFIERAAATEIGDTYVKYTDENGAEHTLACDDVVALGGMNPRRDEAMALYGVAADTVMIGDCNSVAHLHALNRAAFSAVYNL